MRPADKRIWQIVLTVGWPLGGVKFVDETLFGHRMVPVAVPITQQEIAEFVAALDIDSWLREVNPDDHVPRSTDNSSEECQSKRQGATQIGTGAPPESTSDQIANEERNGAPGAPRLVSRMS